MPASGSRGSVRRTADPQPAADDETTRKLPQTRASPGAAPSFVFRSAPSPSATPGPFSRLGCLRSSCGGLESGPGSEKQQTAGCFVPTPPDPRTTAASQPSSPCHRGTRPRDISNNEASPCHLLRRRRLRRHHQAEVALLHRLPLPREEHQAPCLDDRRLGGYDPTAAGLKPSLSANNVSRARFSPTSTKAEL